MEKAKEIINDAKEVIAEYIKIIDKKLYKAEANAREAEKIVMDAKNTLSGAILDVGEMEALFKDALKE